METVINVLLAIGQIASGIFGLAVILSVLIMLFNRFIDKYKGRRRLHDIQRRRTLHEQSKLDQQDQIWANYINTRANSIRENGFSFFEVYKGELTYVNN